MKNKPTPSARKMWANYYSGADGFVCLHGTRTRAKDNAAKDCLNAAVPVAVIPLDDVEGLVSAATSAHVLSVFSRRESMRDALTAIGVLPKKGRK